LNNEAVKVLDEAIQKKIEEINHKKELMETIEEEIKELSESVSELKCSKLLILTQPEKTSTISISPTKLERLKVMKRTGDVLAHIDVSGIKVPILKEMCVEVFSIIVNETDWFPASRLINKIITKGYSQGRARTLAVAYCKHFVIKGILEHNDKKKRGSKYRKTKKVADMPKDRLQQKIEEERRLTKVEEERKLMLQR